MTIHVAYPMPLISDIITRLNDKTVFSKIDPAKAFHQIPVHPDDICKTAVITPFGLFEYIKMPFCHCNAAQSFQRYIDHVLRNLDFARPYLDGILIFFRNSKHLHEVLQCLNDHNLLINTKKCEYFSSEVKFLGHLIFSEGIVQCLKKSTT